MDLISKERDRVLQRSARVYGLSFTVVSMLTLLIPGAVSWPSLLLILPLYLALAAGQFLLGSNRSLVVVSAIVVTGLATMYLVATSNVDEVSEASVVAILHLAAGALPAIGLVLTTSVVRIGFLVASFVLVGTGTVVLTVDARVPLQTIALIVLGWVIATLVAVWVGASIPQVAKRIASMGRAHRAERQASELEAQRRQSARLLHDTVLATLTLLAHSGFGVTADALRQQAGDDARLLRQLRLGSTPTPQASGGYTLEPVAQTELGTTLESVKARFGRMGLEVNWHGTGQVLLPSTVLDAFLLALAECLENVRRHSGVTQAHVTITDDAEKVRAVVTDQGIGFDINDIDEANLGFTESVVARVRDVGGNARLFSSPGAGTTVILEVPR